MNGSNICEQLFIEFDAPLPHRIDGHFQAPRVLQNDCRNHFVRTADAEQLNFAGMIFHLTQPVETYCPYLGIFLFPLIKPCRHICRKAGSRRYSVGNNVHSMH